LLNAGDGAEDSRRAESDDTGRMTPIPQNAMDTLNKEFERCILSAQPSQGWTITSVQLKMAKEVVTLPLHK
jgi:hypothetical protein